MNALWIPRLEAWPVAHDLWRRVALTNTPLKRDADQLLSFCHEFHRQLLQHIAHETVDDEGHGLFLCKPARHAIEHLIITDLARGSLVFKLCRRSFGFDIGNC